MLGWNERSAVPAEDMSITIRIAGTALCLFQPTAGELKNSQAGRGCEFSVGWNEHRAVPAEDMSITIRIAGTALCLFQPTAGELKNSQAGSVVPLWGSYFRHVPKFQFRTFSELILARKRRPVIMGIERSNFQFSRHGSRPPWNLPILSKLCYGLSLRSLRLPALPRSGC